MAGVWCGCANYGGVNGTRNAFVGKALQSTGAAHGPAGLQHKM